MTMNPALNISPNCGALAVDKALTVVAGHPAWHGALDHAVAATKLWVEKSPSAVVSIYSAC